MGTNNIGGLSETILAFSKGSVRRDYYLCSDHPDPFILNLCEA